MSWLCCKKKQIKIAMIGLDDAGKTSLTYLIKNETPMFITPTYGFTSHNIPIKFKNYQISLFDLGGSITIRGYWDNYYSEIHGLIFVIDASDSDRFEEVRKQYKLLTKQKKLDNKPLLIICNKCDSTNFVSSEIIANKILKIDEKNSWNAPYKIIETSVSVHLKTKSIIDQGIRFLLNKVDQDYDLINQKIQSKHEKLLKEPDTGIKIQKLRVQNVIPSPSVSPRIRPGTMQKYSNQDVKVDLELNTDEFSRVSIVHQHDINRPSSAPLHVFRRYVIDNDKRESSL